MQTSIMEITPVVAKALLSGNLGNRKIRTGWVKDLANRTRRGEWQLTHQGIAISKSGILLDGQHRLLAVIASGASIESQVTTGASDDIFGALDEGAKRTLSDHTKWHKKTAEAIRFVTRIATGVTSPTVSQCMEIADSGFKTLHDELMDHSCRTLGYYSTAPVRSAAVLLVMSGEDKGYVFGVYKSLVDQQFDSLPQIALSLIRQVTCKTTNSGNTSDVFVKALKVLSSKNKSINRLVTSEDDWIKATAFTRDLIDNH